MESSPEKQGPIFLSPEEIKIKFDELDMISRLHSTCNAKKIGQVDVESCSKLHQRNRRTGWKGENFVHKTTGESHAVLYWKNTPDGEEVSKIEQFTAPDGTFYVVDSVRID